jgi:spore photoproduct lyase
MLLRSSDLHRISSDLILSKPFTAPPHRRTPARARGTVSTRFAYTRPDCVPPAAALELPIFDAPPPADVPPAEGRSPRLWRPDRALFTPDALDQPWGRQIHDRVAALGIPVEVLRANRLVGLRGRDERETYRIAKRTLSVVTAPAGQLELSPIPPSADWQFHLAQGCPAHCHYCYLAGSLQGPPTVRAYANLPEVLANLPRYVGRATGKRAATGLGIKEWGADAGCTTFEASCYTDPLGIEHLTGSLAEAVRYFGETPAMARGRLRWTTKFSTPAAVAPLLALPHGGRTRARVSLNADAVARRFEGGAAPVAARLAGAALLAGAGYPLGLVIAPIMPVDDWRAHYAALLDAARAALPPDALAGGDLTVELITHRFTAGSKAVLEGWYPNTALEMDEAGRAEKRNKFGGSKFVYPAATMGELRAWFAREVKARWPGARILYWT